MYQLFPPYNLGRGLANLAVLDLESTLKGRTSDPYLWDVTGRSLALMLVEAVAFVILTLLIDSGSLLPIWLSFRAYPAPTSIYSGKKHLTARSYESHYLERNFQDQYDMNVDAGVLCS